MVKMGNVWDRTAEFLSDNISAILPIALIAFFVPTSIAGNFNAASLGASGGVRLSLSLIQLAFAVLSVWGSLAITAMALDIAGTEPPTRTALRRLPSMLVVSIVLLLGMLLLVVPIGVLLAFGGVDFTRAIDPATLAIDPAYSAATLIYLLILAPVLAWLFARLAVLAPVVVREGRMLSAIPQAWRLTRGAALRIFGVLFLFVIVYFVAEVAATTVFGTIFALLTGGGDGEGISLAGVLTSIVAAAVQTGFSVLMAAFVAKLYLALIAEVGLRGAAERI